MASLDNAGVGFALVVAAGLSTAIGAAAVFFRSLVKLSSKPVLAAGLGFSGGVMLYVSFVEIFVKSTDAFVEDGQEESHAYYYSTLCLFAGMLLLRLIAFAVHMIDHKHHRETPAGPGPEIRSNVMGSSDIPQHPGINGDQAPDAAAGSAAGAGAEAGAAAAAAEPTEEEKQAKLHRMGLNTAVAIAIHNFPEGLATFVATLDDPTVGATLAIAIAIHNIPEGLCVALPIYYATGSRLKGFFWALFSGLSEPVGAFIGWLIIKGSGEDLNQVVYGILFGVVAGMMIMIVLLELLPTGFRYDPQDKFLTNSVVLGMVVMAASLCLFIA